MILLKLSILGQARQIIQQMVVVISVNISQGTHQHLLKRQEGAGLLDITSKQDFGIELTPSLWMTV